MTPDNPPEDNRDKPFNPFEENDDFAPFGNQPAPYGNQQQPNYGDQSQGYGNAPPSFDGQQPAYGDQSVPFGAMAQPEFETDEVTDNTAGVAGGFEEPVLLDLGEDDTRLPWLEGDDDEEEYTGYGVGQVIMLVLLGLAALGLLVGGIWWATRDKPDAELVADGGTIPAPSAPYKTRPENPGGEPVGGTGDTRFAVAEGQSRPVQIDETAPAPRPGFQSTEKPGAKPGDAATPAAASAAAGAATADASGVGVQVGAYSTKEAAEKGWAKLLQQNDALSGVKYRILQGQADIGTVYRLQAVPGNAAAADALCRKLKAASVSCQVK